MSESSSTAPSTPEGTLVHMVWFKWASNATPEQINDAFNALLALKEKIPNIVELTVGVNTTNRSNGHTHGLLVKLKSAADLPVYADHPEHLLVVRIRSLNRSYLCTIQGDLE